ncbi:MAG: hypothetical protein KA297_12805 [Kofleriaceae bacterium]|nr:hypothetical protein [Kofleriaceae bacterium]MBP6835662.1 hypothetical protein [Kofleriaceae bacterium]
MTVAIVTFAVLVLELTTTRLYAYVGTTQATATALSLAVLGLGLGALVRVRAPRWVTPPHAACALAAGLLGLAAATVAGAGLVGLATLSLVPFAAAGALVSDAYARRGGPAARATYAIDLAAAGLGSLLAPRLLGPLSPAEIMIALGLGASALAVLLTGRGGRPVPAITLLLVLAQVGLLVAGRTGHLPDGPLRVLLASSAGSEKAIVDRVTRIDHVRDSAWSPLGRLDLHQAPDQVGQRMGLFTDGMSPTYLLQEAYARSGAFEDTWGRLMALPYRAFRPKRVCILGSGAGASVWLARRYGAAWVDGVEVNPALPALLARWRSYAGDVYGEPGVRLITADARRFLAGTSTRYDLIELALALTGNTQAQPAGLEAHLYTVEAVELYLRHLTPTGVLVLIHSDPGNAYRQLLTVLEALARRGLDRARALEGIVVMRDPSPDTAYRYLLVVRPAPIALELVDQLDAPGAELLWGPGDPPERAADLLDARALGATSADDLAPVHDDRPYFFQNTRGLWATATAQPGPLWVLAGAVVLVVVLLADRRGAPSLVRPAVSAAGLGAAFLCVELALIQRFTLAAGGTLYAASFVLFVLLVSGATGAMVLGERWRRLGRGPSWAAVAAALAIVATSVVARDLTWLDAIDHDTLRLVLVAALLAPVGLLLGGPFPVLLAHHGDTEEHIARLWATNGAAAVAGGVVATLSLRVGGVTATLWLAAALYLASALVAPPAR